MAFLFGSSRRDQVHLLSTLQSLNTTSVAGLAAALSWSERKTERVLREVVGQTGTAVRYDAARRTIRVVGTHAAVEVPTGVSGGVASAPAAPAVAAPTPIAPTPILPKEFGGAGRCSRCEVPLLNVATGDAAVCPKCGQMSTRRARPAAAATAPEPARAAAPSAPHAENGRTVVESGDRRSQELFAAWVTSRPIPCPRCRSTLQHRGVGEYGCPSCGHRVVFETNLPAGAARAPTAPVAPAPSR